MILLRVHPRFISEVLLFVPEVTHDLANICIHIVKEKLGDGPLVCISMYPAVAIRHVLPDLWHHASKPRKNGKVTLYDTALALESVKYFSAQCFILTIVVSLCVSVITRIIQVISRSNIFIEVGPLSERVRAIMPIFPIILLCRQK